MRPPEFTGGNRRCPRSDRSTNRFNEAAGIHRRKLCRTGPASTVDLRSRASMRPPEFTGGNNHDGSAQVITIARASMRPPEFTGGNSKARTRADAVVRASMRPPEFTGGNKRPRQHRR